MARPRWTPAQIGTVANRTTGPALVVGLLSIPLPLGASPAPFLAPFVAYETNQAPAAVAVGDVNRDGWLDLVTANVRNATISVLLGNGDGTFAAQTTSYTSVGPRALALADLDGDGALDVAVACYVFSVVSILRGHGDGTFDALANIPTDHEPQGIALDDLDGDSLPDLVTLNSGFHFPPGSVSVRLGRGDGTFGPRTDLATGGIPATFGVADMDRDGFDDLVVANAHPNAVAILRGSAAGTFEPAASIALPGAPGGLALGDWNGDSWPDAAVYHQREEAGGRVDKISVLRGGSGGTLTWTSDLFPLSYAIDMASGDLDGDGHTDLVALGLAAGVYLGRGDGTFALPHPYEAGAFPQNVVVADFDADGRADLATALESQAVAVLLGHGDGGFGIEPLSSGINPQSILLGDLDADGNLDLAVPSPTTQSITVQTGRGDGTFGSRREFPTARKPAFVAAGDLDGDGAPDLVAASFDDTAGYLSVLLGDGHGGFAPHVDLPLAGPAPWLALGDWNGDGHLDAAVTEWTAEFPNDGSVEVFFGAGDGTFTPGPLVAVGPMPWGLAAADLEGDGALDLVVAYRYRVTGPFGGVTVLHGDGAGGFGNRTDILTGVEPRAVAIGDLDADGHPDIVVANSNFGREAAGNLAVLRGQGDGSFATPRSFRSGVETFGVALADLDGDGWLDVVGANATANTVTWRRGRGDGELGERVDLGCGRRPLAVAVGDLDGDHRVDVVAANSATSTVTILLNRTLTTPVLVEALTAVGFEGGVRLEWDLAASGLASLRGVRVEGAAQAIGPFTALAPRDLTPARHMTYVDPDAASGSRSWYRLVLVDSHGGQSVHGPVTVLATPGPGGLGLDPPQVAAGGTVNIRYRLGRAVQDLQLVVLDARGRRVCSLAGGPGEPGEHACTWNAQDSNGRRVARGVYWLRLGAGGRTVSRRILLLRG